MHSICKFLCLAFVAGTSARAAREPEVSPDGLWVDVPVLQSATASNVWVNPPVFRSVALDHAGMRAVLAGAPLEGAGVPIEMWLPLPDGSFGRFAVAESPVMEAGLQALFPEIRTYVGQGMDDAAATVRLDLTPAGFHAQVLGPRGAAYIDKHTRDAGVYAAYWKADHRREAESFRCLVPGGGATVQSAGAKVSGLSVGATLRRYRAAVAATAEYTSFHGGTVSNGLAAIVTTVNRVNGIYETELGIRLVLVSNNHLVVYTNQGTDPYNNNNASQLLTQNQANLDSVIGSANYDIGHVVNTDGGGLAALGVVCNSSYKAQGETGSSSPVGDSFDVDYVAHEMGHQFGADHTFNGSAGSCGGNREPATAYEVGSGSTIMSYAGICNGDDLQSQADPFFHSASFDQIITYVTAGEGANCAVLLPTTNNPPSVGAGSVRTIPMRTPFELVATGGDTNGDAVTFCWEERDLGAAQTLGAADNGSSPIIRAFRPTTSPVRFVPALTNLLNNTTNVAVQLPSTARTLSFRVTARDNRAGGGGVTNADTSVIVATNAGPFVVTSMNSGGTFSGLVAVTWNVANTTNAPVNCANVTITLSTNGGSDQHFTLAASVPNSGTALVPLPNIFSTKARIKVAGAGNIFFDVNNANFAIVPGGLIPIIAGGTNTVIAESCLATNGAADPGEQVTFRFALRNVGTGPTTNITATLVTNGSVAGVSSSQTYGVLAPGGAEVARSFTFIANGACGGSVTGVLQVREGTNVLGLVTALLPLGGIAVVQTQAFDAVTAPALPAGWTTSATGAQSPWATTTTGDDSVPNAAFSPDPNDIGVNELISPAWMVSGGAAELQFRHRYNLEQDVDGTYDGGVLEIKVGAAAFADVLDAGCTFLQNGYVASLVVGTENPLGGRACWGGDSGVYLTTRLRLPPNAAGQSVQFRWRCATDASVADGGWWVDGITLFDSICCSNAPAADLALTMVRLPPQNVVVTQAVWFALAVSNRGGASASGVIVSNPVPSFAAPLSATASTGSCTTNGGVLVCNLGTLANGATASVSVVLLALNPTAQISVLTNRAAVSAGTSDPVATNDSASANVVVFKDSLGDGVPDFWRQQHFGSATTTNASSCATCDADGDGFDNRSEFLADTVPTNAASFLRVDQLAALSASQIVYFATSTGRVYSVEFSGGATTGLWQLSNTPFPGPGGPAAAVSTNAVSPGFFRLKAALP